MECKIPESFTPETFWNQISEWNLSVLCWCESSHAQNTGIILCKNGQMTAKTMADSIVLCCTTWPVVSNEELLCYISTLFMLDGFLTFTTTWELRECAFDNMGKITSYIGLAWQLQLIEGVSALPSKQGTLPNQHLKIPTVSRQLSCVNVAYIYNRTNSSLFSRCVKYLICQNLVHLLMGFMYLVRMPPGRPRLSLYLLPSWPNHRQKEDGRWS